jgi:D-alanyl-D-alanine carboxypeptidase (penicillin-binding protein 5/6)
MMNKRAKELGCTGTTFVNAHGLHDQRQVSTARDIAKITAKILEQPEYKAIFGTAKYTVPATNTSSARHLVTVNYMIDEEYRFSFYYSKVTGGRTGITEYGERCLVVTAEDDDSSFIGVILGAEAAYRKDNPEQIKRHGSFEDMDKLLDMGFGKYSVNQVLYRGQILDQIHVPNGENDIVVGPVTDLFCTLPEGVTADDLTNRVQMISTSVEAPVKFGDKIAVVQLWYGNVCVAQANVQAMNSAKVGQLYTDGNNGSGLFDAGAFSTAVTVLIVIGALILGLSIGMLIMRRMNEKRNYRRRRRRR